MMWQIVFVISTGRLDGEGAAFGVPETHEVSCESKISLNE